MQITLNKGKSFSVTIQGDFTGPTFKLEVSPTTAFELLLALDAKRDELRDMMINYYDCPECGETHHHTNKSIEVCPARSEP